MNKWQADLAESHTIIFNDEASALKASSLIYVKTTVSSKKHSFKDVIVILWSDTHFHRLK